MRHCSVISGEDLNNLWNKKFFLAGGRKTEHPFLGERQAIVLRVIR